MIYKKIKNNKNQEFYKNDIIILFKLKINFERKTLKIDLKNLLKILTQLKKKQQKFIYK